MAVRRAAEGPRRMVKDGRVPLIDIGTLARIRNRLDQDTRRHRSFTSDGVVFTDAMAEAFDAAILATGFRPDLRGLIPDVEGVFDAHGMPLLTDRASAAPAFYFCGQITVPTGQLREIGIDARQIAESAKAHVRR